MGRHLEIKKSTVNEVEKELRTNEQRSSCQGCENQETCESRDLFCWNSIAAAIMGKQEWSQPDKETKKLLSRQMKGFEK